jgi:hypothetical protein
MKSLNSPLGWRWHHPSVGRLERGLALWLVFAVIAPLNGALRQFLLIPQWGEAVGHVVSTLMLSAIIVAVTWRALRWLQLPSMRAAWGLGLLWLALTVAFEFGAGHFLFGAPWAKLLAEYNLAAGRIWMLVLLATLLAPVVAFRFRNG